MSVHLDHAVRKVIEATVDLMAFLAHLVRRVIRVLMVALAYLDRRDLKEEMALRDKKGSLVYLVKQQFLS